MKITILFSLICLLFFSLYSSAQTRHVIKASDFLFTPSSLTGVKVGDTIEWSWVEGSHTVASAIIPATATSWNFTINALDTIFKYAVKVAGTYNYVCIPHEGLGMKGSFVVDAAASISSFVLNEIRLEPIPAHDFVNIKLSNPLAAHTQVNIYDMLGRKVLSREFEISSGDTIYSVDIDNLIEGIYFVTISSGEITGRPLRMIKR